MKGPSVRPAIYLQGTIYRAMWKTDTTPGQLITAIPHTLEQKICLISCLGRHLPVLENTDETAPEYRTRTLEDGPPRLLGRRRECVCREDLQESSNVWVEEELLQG